MGHRHLVVSDPPHHELDHDRASELLGIAPAEVRMKANFAAPEIWLTFSDAEEATDAALALGEAGLNTATIDGRGFLDVPGPAPLSSFAFTDESFVARFGDEERRLPYDAKIFGVFCQPPKGSGPPPFKRSSAGRIRLRSTVAWSEKIAGSGQGGDGFEALEFLTNLDLYWTTDDKVSRISIVKDSADFSGLGDLGGTGRDANMEALLSELERRFEGLTLDIRLRNISPRQRIQVGTTAPVGRTRQLFAFGTSSLRQLLEQIDLKLGDLTQFEFGSRLAYLLHRRIEGGS